MNRIVLFFAFVLLFSSCREKIKKVTPNYSIDYMPIDVGLTRLYHVDSVQWDDFTGTVDTISWEVKEEIGGTFIDLFGRVANKLLIYQRPDALSPWKIEDVGSVVRTATGAERMQDNLRYLNVVFPTRTGREWDGTVFIGDLSNYSGVFNPPCITELDYIKDWQFKYQAVDWPFTLNGMAFDSTLHILHEGDSSLFDYSFGVERFAKNVGLIYKEYNYFSTQDTDFGSPWSVRTECGFSVTKTLYDFILP